MAKIQSDESKRIKRINTNIKAIGVKYGKNSIQYKNAVSRAQSIFNTDNISSRVSYTKSGYFSIRNTKANQSSVIQAKLKELEQADEMSTSKLTKASKQQIKSMKEDTRKELEEKARKSLKQKGVKKINQKVIENEMVNINTKYVSGLDWVVNNTDEWYKYAFISDEIQRVKDLLKTKERRKEYEELEDIIETVRSEVDRIEKHQQEGYDLAHNEHEGEITFNSTDLMTREQHNQSHFKI